MLLESLNALVLAADDALQTSCGLTVVGHHVSLVRQGSLTFPALSELRIKGAALQKVHLGADALLCSELVSMLEGGGAETGIEALSRRFLQQLLGELDGRNPRGEIVNIEVGPVSLASRGLRSFGLRMETEAGQFFLLAEVPSKWEMEIAKGSDFVTAMEQTYLPREWGNRQAIDSKLAIDNFLVFLRKVEADVHFEISGDEDGSHIYSGIMIDNGTFEGERGLKFCTDFSNVVAEDLTNGDQVRATVGVEDRSLQFTMTYLGQSAHAIGNGATVPCAFFLPPESITISQRRLAFRIPVAESVMVDVYCGGNDGDSPWSDQVENKAPIFCGQLTDLSFSGARIVAGEIVLETNFELGRKIICDIRLDENSEALTV
ncbi:MAG: hypothetical protein ACI9JE_000752, partial [Candidatus Krumholzibacteriia bacterium]